MKHFLKLIERIYPSTYPMKLKSELKRNFTQGQLKQIDLFLKNWKNEIFEEMEEEHIKG